MRFPLAVPAAAIVAVAIAACAGGQPSTYIAPPSAASVAPAAGPVTLNGTGQPQSGGTAGGVTSVLTYTGGSGTVTAASSTTPPTGTIAVTPADRIRVEASPSATSPNVYYLVISSAAGATLTNLPAINLTVTPAAIGTYQEAQFTSGKWNNIATSASNGNSAGVGATSLSFPAGKSAVTIPAGGSIFLAFYQGSFPAPTPSGQIVNTAIGDPGFESPAAQFGTPVTTTGWTVCSINTLAAGAKLNAGRPFSTFTPVPGHTPEATIAANGTSIVQATGSPKPTQTTVPVQGGNQAAVIGGVFSDFVATDFAYNGLCTKVTVPQNPVASIGLFVNGTENVLADLAFQVNVLDTTGAYLANIYEENGITANPPGDMQYRTVPLPSTSLSAFAGQTVELYVGIWTNDGSSKGATTFGAFYFVDNFNMAGS